VQARTALSGRGLVGPSNASAMSMSPASKP